MKVLWKAARDGGLTLPAQASVLAALVVISFLSGQVFIKALIIVTLVAEAVLGRAQAYLKGRMDEMRRPRP